MVYEGLSAIIEESRGTCEEKAIEIANAMVDEGYEEGRAIPIATSQAKEWKENASKEEIDQLMKHDDETKRGN